MKIRHLVYLIWGIAFGNDIVAPDIHQQNQLNMILDSPTEIKKAGPEGVPIDLQQGALDMMRAYSATGSTVSIATQTTAGIIITQPMENFPAINFLPKGSIGPEYAEVAKKEDAEKIS